MTRARGIALVGALVAGAASARAADVAAGGVFDMSKSPRRNIAFMALRQDGNRYPSYWCGDNAGGKTTLAVGEDALAGGMSLRHEGAFKLAFSHAANKIGMDDKIPCGAWRAEVRKRNVVVEFTSLTNARMTGRKRTGKGKERDTVTLFAVDCAGVVSVAGRSGKFSGTAELSFSSRLPTFSMCARVTFTGADLGLRGAQRGKIKATIHTASTNSVARPRLRGDAVDDLLDVAPGGLDDELGIEGLE